MNKRDIQPRSPGEGNTASGTESTIVYQLHSGSDGFSSPEKHSLFVFSLFEKGSGVHVIDSIPHQVGDNQLHLVFPGQLHNWQLDGHAAVHQVMVSKDVFNAFAGFFRYALAIYRKHPVVSFSPGNFQIILYEFRAIQAEMEARRELSEIIQSRIRIIAQMIGREAEYLFSRRLPQGPNPILFKFLSLIDEHFRNEKTVEFYARQLHITPTYLTILCRKQFNQSASEIIGGHVVLEAKRLLQVLHYNISEIAYELGFSDLAYFSHFFKKNTGMSPREFRGLLH